MTRLDYFRRYRAAALASGMTPDHFDRAVYVWAHLVADDEGAYVVTEAHHTSAALAVANTVRNGGSSPVLDVARAAGSPAEALAAWQVRS